jgi:hypothetical protein
MFEQSIIKKSGQWWKAVVSFVTMAGGGLIVFFSLADKSLLFPLIVGMILVAFGFVFGCLAIRCPECKARWVWRAVKGQSASQWFPWLFSHKECPYCKDDNPPRTPGSGARSSRSARSSPN